MNELGNRLRQLGNKLRSFSAGRYGTDRLGMVMLCISLVLTIVTGFIKSTAVWLVLMVISYSLMVLAIVRMFSRNTYRRYEENRRFLQLFDQIKDRNHRYFNCPRCRQRVRVPRGKGKISITCPKCREKFVKKT